MQLESARRRRTAINSALCGGSSLCTEGFGGGRLGRLLGVA